MYGYGVVRAMLNIDHEIVMILAVQYPLPPLPTGTSPPLKCYLYCLVNLSLYRISEYLLSTLLKCHLIEGIKESV